MKQEVWTTSTNGDDEDNQLVDAQVLLAKKIYELNGLGWAYQHHTETKDEDGDYLIFAVFTRQD